MNQSPFNIPSLARRRRRERGFYFAIIASLGVTLGFLGLFLFSIIGSALPALKQTYIEVPVSVNERALRFPSRALAKDTRALVSRAWVRLLPQRVEAQGLENGEHRFWALADDQVDQWAKGRYHTLSVSQQQQLEVMRAAGQVMLRWNIPFLTRGDSKLAEAAGLYAAIIGSIVTLAVTMVLAFPIGVATAIYLEEFARESRFNQFIEVNINNLAAIPSILFGLLGLSVFINLFGLPRSSPLVGGMTLALMTLPIIIVSARAALRSVPDSIRQAGYGLGLSKVQVVKGHVLPIAMPGILTGAIIGLAQAMGETAPLIIIGMIAFIPEAPTSIFDAATVLPAQIFTWAGMPERAYLEKTAAGILVILLTLVALNGLAIYLRRKYEIKW